MFRAPVKVIKLTCCSFRSMKHTVLSEKGNEEFCPYIQFIRGSKNKESAKHCRENDNTFNFQIAKDRRKSPTLHLNLTSFKHFIFIKDKVLSSVISPPLHYQIVRNLTFILISPDSSFSFCFYKHLSLLFSYWSIPFVS